ncbi:SufB/SufD family protein [Paracoccus aerodenitrificans]|uniref:SufB/SufD family protein n=1 Tax=Paracoccus aerodenitrificans TaxID=3017781 RepID=UPI0022F03D1F|nr:SufD family Fe-S cluster assembly protein [Paracoccus aerodenitrificans]WBU64649.1 SufD family Fe-S cluster assembly protein [Paracoccus aerodenitrificans]
MADTAVKTRQVTPEIAGSGDDPALSARLEALDLPQGGFTARARQEALARLRKMGLPRSRDEYWRYTDPAAFNAPRPDPIAIAGQGPDGPLFQDLDRVKLVFVDGALDLAESDDLALEGVEIASLAQVDEAGGDHWAADLYGTLEGAAHEHVARPLGALNTAVARDGALIRVSGKPSRPLHMIHRRKDETADVYYHHVIRLEPGAELTLLETGMTGARSNFVLEVDLGEAARFHHIAAKRAGHEKLGWGGVFARIAAEAQFKSFALSVNGTLMRHESVIDIVGDDAVAHIAAAVLGDANRGDFHHDDTVFITHDAERCESRQVFKKVLKNGAKGIFQGKILVQPGAQKTDGYQISQALLLDENSQFLGKPELEIYADDVQCSHGSTTGAIDETALFYLRSRGVPKERAIILMVLSFLADALAEVEDEGLREEINDRLDAWLTRHS